MRLRTDATTPELKSYVRPFKWLRITDLQIISGLPLLWLCHAAMFTIRFCIGLPVFVFRFCTEFDSRVRSLMMSIRLFCKRWTEINYPNVLDIFLFQSYLLVFNVIV